MTLLDIALWLFIGGASLLAALIYLDLASDDIAGAFRDALDAFRDLFRP